LPKNQIRRVLEANFRIQQGERAVQKGKPMRNLPRTTANVAAQKPTTRHQEATRAARRTTKLRVKAIAAQTGALRTVTVPRDQVTLLGPAVPLLEEGKQPTVKSLFTNKHIRYEKSNSNPSVFNKHTALLRPILVL
tara:strand:+ start:22391 stop:22798 length:408 start_codon:yes stop_codon:yes gene_type:complete